ncbi:unnamed protein product [Fusarium graminearum]|nr:unnamed protein product [Fusarium graminearum]
MHLCLEKWAIADLKQRVDGSSMPVYPGMFNGLDKYMENPSNNKSKLNPHYVTGFSDGESCFHLSIGKNSKYKIGYYVNPGFTIVLHKKDELLLRSIQSFFGGIGNLKVLPNIVQYRVFSLKDLDIILNHFDNYPLITKKHTDFLLFKEALALIKNKEHLTIEGFNKIIALKSSMNLGLPEVLKESFPDILGRKIEPFDLPSAVGGAAPNKEGLRSVIGFQISQHSRDLPLMEKFISFFECGNRNVQKYVEFFTVQCL